MVKGYKVFDSTFKCRDFQFEVGKRYVHNSTLSICKSGFHFCKKLSDCYNYYDFNESNKIAEVIAHGEIQNIEDKSCTNDIEIVKEISWVDCLILVNAGKNNLGRNNTGNWNTGNRNTGNNNTGCCNTGYWNTGDSNTGDRNTGNSNTGNCNTGNSNTGNSNTGNCNTGDSNTGCCNTGYWNTGDSNTGYCNTGDRNTGNRNTGNCNTGDLNKCDFSSGVLCTDEQKILIFDKQSEMTLKEWRYSEFSNLFCGYNVNLWCNESEMTEQDKIENPKFYVQGGFLKVLKPEQAWENWFKTKTKEEVELIKKIPNFDSKKFKYITGIDIQ